MRFELSDDQQAIADAARDALRETCPPPVVRAAWDGAPATDAWGALAELGALGIAVDEDHGGLGLGHVALHGVLLAAGEVALPGDLVAHVALTPLLAALDEPALPAALDGARLAAVHALHPHAEDADRAARIAVLSDAGVACLDPARAQLTPRASVDGARRLFDVDHDSAPRRGDAALVAAAVDRAAWAASVVLIGLSRRALDLAVEHAGVRAQFGRPIGSFQAVKHQLADALLAIELAEPHALHAGWCLDHAPALAPGAVSLAKKAAGEAATVATRAALQVHGAIGYSFEHDLHLWMKRAWALSRTWGDAAWHRRRLATLWLDGDLPDPTEFPHA